ncbi:Polyphenol oxidase B, chloroplastic [Sesamum alatum]|uniref:Polyphenol oxidase B, chloroplastic n=1 Tax=Sesamum alatum TaxID=300844 RepID=A0AAE1XYW7_9LAMI|nr:Polyphenol oxidase B, chloroplastic [Sesamum alatum]
MLAPNFNEPRHGLPPSTCGPNKSQARSSKSFPLTTFYRYNKAIKCMKKLEEDDPSDPRGFMPQANIHYACCNGTYTYDSQIGQDRFTLQVHDSWLFYPFHRSYLYFYRRILGKLIDDPSFALTFWNWDNAKGMRIPKFFCDPNSTLYDYKRNQKYLKAVVDQGLLAESLIVKERSQEIKTRPETIERAAHSLVHCDKIPDMMIQSDNFLKAEFFFYDENAQLVQLNVADCLDNQRIGYNLEQVDLLWVDYWPPAQIDRRPVPQTFVVDSIHYARHSSPNFSSPI